MEAFVNTTRRRELVYLGWQGNANFGDELIYDYWKAVLDAPLDATAPLSLGRYLVKEAAAFIPSRIRLRGSERAILLGGGTTVGFGTWAEHAKLAKHMFGARRMFAAGAGAAEVGDAFTLDRQPHDWQAWREIAGFDLLGVRGPLTASACAAELRPSPVIGDPALGYPAVVELSPRRREAIGLCLGSEGSSRFNVAEVARGVKDAAERMNASIVLFQMTDADAPVNDALRELLGDVPVERFSGDVLGMMNAIAGTRAFVSERLHGTVAAVAAGVAATPLAYASKCDDFWLSVTGERTSLQTSSTAAEITSAVLASTDERSLSHIAGRVADHQRTLAEAAGRIRRWLDGEDRPFVPAVAAARRESA